MKSEDRITYAQAVWASWQDKAKSKRDMSSAEYHIIGKWMNKSIPCRWSYGASMSSAALALHTNLPLDGMDQSTMCYMGSLPSFVCDQILYERAKGHGRRSGTM